MGLDCPGSWFPRPGAQGLGRFLIVTYIAPKGPITTGSMVHLDNGRGSYFICIANVNQKCQLDFQTSMRIEARGNGNTMRSMQHGYCILYGGGAYVPFTLFFVFFAPFIYPVSRFSFFYLFTHWIADCLEESRIR